MDHMPIAKGCLLPAIDVPTLEYIPYDFGGLKGFAARLGYMQEGHLDRNLGLDRLASIQQSWLYFGLLSDFLGRLIGPGDFGLPSVAGLEGQPLRSSHTIPRLLYDWQIQLRSRGVSACDDELLRARSVIQQAVTCSLIFDKVAGGSERYAAVCLSVKLLIMTLILIYNSTGPEHPFSFRDRNLFPLVSTTSMPSAGAQLLIERMRQAKWCPQAIRRVCISYNYATAYYLCNLPRLRDADHSLCSEEYCVAYNTGDSTYRSKHTDQGCECEHIPVNTARIVKIITDGDVPLLRFRSKGAGDLKLQIAKRSSLLTRSSYHAVSHVWCDGLGNPMQNSLPRCQILKLIRLMSNLRSQYIWIDTLCIPVGDENRQVRNLAINAMASIYKDADKTIVLDEEVQKFLQRGLGDGVMEQINLMAYALISAWNTRCWTFQEAALGREWAFDATSRLLKPDMDDAVFLPDKPGLSGSIESCAFRWTIWRGFSQPRRVLPVIRWLFALLPITGSITTPFQISCGPQAWARCRDDVWPIVRHGQLRRAGDLPLALLWLLLACLVSILTFPVALLITINGIFVTVMAWSIVFIYARIVIGVQPTDFSTALIEQMRFALASELAIELRPRKIARTHELHQAQLAASWRMTQFIQIWNSLLSRNTTKTADIHCILAALTDIVPFRITSLPTSEERMRAIIGCYNLLPLELIFSSAGVKNLATDSKNRWLPAVPTGRHLRNGETSARMQLIDGELIINLSEAHKDVLAFEENSSKCSVQPVQLYDPSSKAIFLEESDEIGRCLEQQTISEVQATYFLVETPREEMSPSTRLYRGVELTILRKDGNVSQCEFKRAREFTMRSRQSDDEQTSKESASLRKEGYIKIPFVTSDAPGTTYRQPISWAELAYIWGSIPICLLGLYAWLLVFGTQLSWIVVYVGAPVILIGWIASWLIAAPGFQRWSAARYDERMAHYAETGIVRFIAAWSLTVAENLRHREGKLEAWYHYVIDGRFSRA